MIRRPTWILLAVFAVLLGAVIVFQRTKKTQVEELVDLPIANLETPQPIQFLFEIPEGESILGLEIKDATGNRVEVQRQNESAEWALVTPEGEADLARIDQAVSQVSTMQISSTLQPDLALDAVGLNQPGYILRVTLGSGKKLTTYFGDTTISNSGYYARQAGGPPVVIGKYSVDQIINLLITPPISPTPIPSPADDGQP